jgi:O-antigen/teichoic acid export membrane protein
MTRFIGRSLGGEAAIYLLASIASSALPFLLMPFLTRWLGPADFGIVGSYVALNGVLAAFIGLSTHGLVSVVYYRDGSDSMRPQIGAAIGVCSAGTLSCLLLVWLGRDLVIEATSIPLVWLLATVISAAGQFLITLILTVFQTLRRPSLYAFVQFGYSLILAFVTFLLVGMIDAGWEGRILAQLFAAILLAFIGLTILSRMQQVDWRPGSWPMRNTLAFGLPLLPHALSALAMASIDRFVLNAQVGSVAVGQYFAAVQITSLLVVLATAINQAWLPWLYGHLAKRTDASDRLIVKATLLMFAALLAVGLALSFSASFIIPLVAGPGFEDAIPVLQILGPAASFNASYLFVASILFYNERTRLLSTLTMSAAALQIVLSISLGAWLGMIGVAIAAATSAAYYWLATWVSAGMIHPLPWTVWGVRARVES